MQIFKNYPATGLPYLTWQPGERRIAYVARHAMQLVVANLGTELDVHCKTSKELSNGVEGQTQTWRAAR